MSKEDKIDSSIIRDEIKELRESMSVLDLIRYTDSDNLLIAIDNALEEIAIERIIDRTQDVEELIKRGRI